MAQASGLDGSGLSGGRSTLARWSRRLGALIAAVALVAGGPVRDPAELAKAIGPSGTVVGAAVPDDRYPNEPDGFQRVAEHGFSGLPISGTADFGEWSDPTSPANYSIAHPATPSNDSAALRVRFPAGLAGGTSPGKFDFWSELNVSEAPRYRQLYISWVGRIVEPVFENHRVATKLFYFAYGNSRSLNAGGLTLNNGTGAVAFQSRMEMRAFVSPADDRESGSVNYHPNMRRARPIVAGRWHHIEMLLSIGTPDRSDGMLRVWVDRRLALNYSDVKFLDSDFGFTDGFFQMQWAPVWGGRGGTRSRDNYMEVDHLYVSGFP